MAKSPRPEDAEKVLSQASVRLRDSTQSPAGRSVLMGDARVRSVDTGVRMLESEDADTVLLDMPRGSPAEICVRINSGDRVLGSPPSLPVPTPHPLLLLSCRLPFWGRQELTAGGVWVQGGVARGS